MLKDRILATLKFFDLQDIPLTLLELHRFLIGDLDRIRLSQDKNWELFVDAPLENPADFIGIEKILACLDADCRADVENSLGFYHLKNRSEIANLRWKNYSYGIKRERRINFFLPSLRHIPFVRGAAVGGSQSLGQQKETSDIDLFILVEPGFMWLTRTLISAYFQIFGIRRHGKKVKNRFCLNHYVAGPKRVNRERDLYKAMEYARLRGLVYPSGVADFLEENSDWIRVYLPHFSTNSTNAFLQKQSTIQKFFEKLLNNFFGAALDKFLGFWQKLKIHQDEFIFVLPDELSFHPHSHHRMLLSKFFGS